MFVFCLASMPWGDWQFYVCTALILAFVYFFLLRRKPGKDQPSCGSCPIAEIQTKKMLQEASQAASDREAADSVR